MKQELFQINAILKQRLSQFDVTLDQSQRDAVSLAMNDYAIRKVQEQNSKQVKEMSVSFWKTLVSFDREKWIIYIRNYNRKKAKKLGQYRANIENRKIYGVRAGLFSYTLLSTKDVEFRKRIRQFRKNVDAKQMHELADFVCYPQNTTSPKIKKK